MHSKAHHCKTAIVNASLFSKTVDPLTNFVKDKVFRVTDGAAGGADPFEWSSCHEALDDPAVCERCSGAYPCLDAWLVETL